MRICTYNIENLFSRYLFNRDVDKKKAIREGFTSEDLRFRLADPTSKRLSAQVLLDVDADVFALQEVESMDTLKGFRDQMLHSEGDARWPHLMLIDGNDHRMMDVAILSKHPIVHARSWQHLEQDGKPIFDRDCLEVDIEHPTLGLFTLYNNHFKSMRGPRGKRGPGRSLTRERRQLQSRTVIQLVRQRFGDEGKGRYIIAGDLNDHARTDDQGKSGIMELLEWDAVENILDRSPVEDRWTHYFRGDKRRGISPAYNQLDYLLLSKELAQLHPGLPRIHRRGIPGRANRFQGKRLNGVGTNRPKASDHCPLVFDFQ